MSQMLVEADEFAYLSGHARDQAFMETEREIRRLHALQMSRVRTVEASMTYLDDQYHSVTSWLQAVTNCARSSALHTVQSAHMLHQLPALAAATEAGTVGPDQLRLLCRLYENDRARPHLPESDALLTEYAQALRLGEFRKVCQRWEAHADPDGTHRSHELSRSKRSVSLSTQGKGFTLTATGDALTGDMLRKIIDEHTEAEFELDVAERASVHGDDAVNHPLSRTGTQRRFDAFVNVIFKGAGTTETTAQTPIVNIFCTEHVLKEAIREYFGGDRETASEVAVSERFRLCETASGAPVSSRDLVIALIGQVRRVVVDTAGRVVDLGRRSRLFTGAAREAITLAGHGCCWPGCNRNAFNIQIDHMSAWAALKGTTSPTNGASMCAKHNQQKEAAGVRLTRDETGWHHYRTDGTEIAPRAG
jgi:hypothetical protein